MTSLRNIIAAGSLVLSQICSAVPLTIVDPFANAFHHDVAEISVAIFIPSDTGVGSVGDSIVDSDLPSASGKIFTVIDDSLFVQAAIDSDAGFISATVEDAIATTRATVFTRDLPTGVALDGVASEGMRSMASLQVWGAAPAGVQQPQNPGFYGLLLWEFTPSGARWAIERWTWSTDILAFPDITVLAHDTTFATFDPTMMGSYVNQIANGRAIDYYSAAVSVQTTGSIPDASVHARLDFASPLPISEPPVLFLVSGGLLLLLIRQIGTHTRWTPT